MKEALQQIDAYTLNKRVRKQFVRRRTNVFFPYQQIGKDLLTIGRLKSKNSPYTQILLATDNFSRFTWYRIPGIPLSSRIFLVNAKILLPTYYLIFRWSFLKSKSAIDVANGFKKILISMSDTPTSLLVDNGKVFN